MLWLHPLFISYCIHELAVRPLNVRWQEEKAAKELAKEREQEGGAEEKKDEDKPQPNPQLEQGATLPARMGEFPPEMFGLPIEDVDEYYFNKYVRILVY